MASCYREQPLSSRTETEGPTRRESLLAADPLMAAGAGGLPLDAVGAPPATAESAIERRRRLDRDGNRRHRRRLSALYAELRALLPGLPTPRRPLPVSREQILAAATARVKALEDAAAMLEAYRGRPRPSRREVGVSSGTVTFTARLPALVPAGALRRVVEAVERRGVRVLVATMARHGGREGAAGFLVVTVTAAAAAPEVVEMIRADIARIN